MQEFISSITTPGLIVGFVIGALFVAFIARVEKARARRK